MWMVGEVVELEGRSLRMREFEVFVGVEVEDRNLLVGEGEGLRSLEGEVVDLDVR